MSANRKREQFNQRINEKHERKELKEEEQRLMRMQIIKGRKSAGRFSYDEDALMSVAMFNDVVEV